jgi:hypothetical protein
MPVRTFLLHEELKSVSRQIKRIDPRAASLMEMASRCLRPDCAPKAVGPDVLELEKLYALIDPRPEKDR